MPCSTQRVAGIAVTREKTEWFDRNLNNLSVISVPILPKFCKDMARFAQPLTLKKRCWTGFNRGPRLTLRF
jgi:hypothetical protein